MRTARTEKDETATDPARGTWLAFAFPGTAALLVLGWTRLDGPNPEISLPVLAIVIAAASVADRIALPLSARGWYTAATPVVVLAGLLGGPVLGAAAGAATAAADTDGAWRRRLTFGGIEAQRGFVAGLAGLVAVGGSGGALLQAALAVGGALAVQTACRLVVCHVRRVRFLPRALEADAVEALAIVPLLALLTTSMADGGALLPLLTGGSLLAALALVARHLRRDRDRFAAEWRLARTDPGTNLPNRRAFDEALVAEHARIMRGGRRAALLLLDLDHFKVVNDRFGYAAGNRLLEEVGRRLTEGVRRTDVVARWGGEEFVVLAPGVDTVQGAEALAEEARQIVSQATVEVGLTAVTVTVSLGATLLDGAIPVDESFREANEALRRAKLDRNRSIVHDEAAARERTELRRPAAAGAL